MGQRPAAPPLRRPQPVDDNGDGQASALAEILAYHRLLSARGQDYSPENRRRLDVQRPNLQPFIREYTAENMSEEPEPWMPIGVYPDDADGNENYLGVPERLGRPQAPFEDGVLNSLFEMLMRRYSPQ